MKTTLRLAIATLLVGALGLATLAPAASAHHAPSMDGEYLGTDIVDGSELTLWIIGGNEKLALFDEAGTVCEEAGLGFVPALHFGDISPTGEHTFDVTGDVHCLISGKIWEPVINDHTIHYSYDPGSHQLKDSTSQTYDLN